MRDLDGKITGGTLTADEWNEMPTEIQNIITNALYTQTLITGDLNQLGKGVAGYAASATFYTGSGTANAHIATPLSGMQTPPNYGDGMVVRFRPSTANTAAATINVNSLGVKSIKKEDGSALGPGDLDTTRDAWIRYNGTDFLLSNWSATAAPVTPITPIGYLSGLRWSWVDDDTFGVSAGTCRNLDDDTTLILASAFTKDFQSSAGWVAGSGNAGMPTGVTKSANTPYHVFVIRKTAGALVDIGIDSSLIAANLKIDSGYDHFRRVATMRLDATSDIIEVVQFGDYFSRVSDQAGVAWSGETQTFDDDDLLVPDDFRVLVNMNIHYDKGGAGYGYAYPGDESRTAVQANHNFGTGQSDDVTTHVQVLTSPIGEIDLDVSLTAGASSIMNTDGYFDRRGQDGVEPTV